MAGITENIFNTLIDVGLTLESIYKVENSKLDSLINSFGNLNTRLGDLTNSFEEIIGTVNATIAETDNNVNASLLQLITLINQQVQNEQNNEGNEDEDSNQIFDELLSEVRGINNYTSNIDDNINKVVTDFDRIITILEQQQEGGGASGEGGLEGEGGEEDEGGRNKGKNRKGLSQASNILSQKNDLYMLAALAAGIPLVGTFFSSQISSVLRAVEDRDKTRNLYYGVIGEYLLPQNLRSDKYKNIGNRDEIDTYSYNTIGLSKAQAYEKYIKYLRANVNASYEDLYFEKGFSLNEGILQGLLASTRKDVSDKSSGQLGISLLNNLLISGVNRKEVRGYSEEYLKILVDLNQRQLETIGHTNSDLNSIAIQYFSRIKDFQDPAVLGKVVSSIQSGLSQASTPQVEALQYLTLSKLNPDANLWDLELMRENPFGEKSRGYTEQFIKDIISISGSEMEAKFNLKSIFPGLSANLIESLFKNLDDLEVWYSNLNSISQIDAQNLGGFKLVGENSEAERATSPFQSHTASYEDLKADIGEPIVTAILSIEEWIMDGAEYVVQGMINMYNEGLQIDTPFGKTTLIQANNPQPGGQPSIIDMNPF